MSMSVDEKVVSMKFDNKQFEKGVAQSIKTIDKLNKSTDLKGAKKGFDEMQRAADNVNFSKLEQNVGSLAKRFSTMGVAGMTVIQDITNGAINMGKKLLGALNAPLTQIKSGGFSRALNLEQAQFQIEGLGKSWEKLKEDINYGVESTAYGLDAAAKAAAQLSASQVEAGDDMKAALRGISGVAAMTGASYEDISNVFTTVAGNGRLMSQQLLQLSSRGINAAAALGEQLGKSEAEIRDMVTKGKIDFATFSKAMDDAFGKHAKDANKTFEGSISNVKAALSKIGALFAEPIITNAIGPINALREGLNQVKAVLEENGGIGSKFAEFAEKLSKLITAIMTNKNVLDAITSTTKGLVGIFGLLAKVANRVAAAFFQVFPPKTVEQIKTIADQFSSFVDKIKLSEDTLNKLQSVARGVFSVFRIMINVVGLLKDIFVDIAKSKVGHFFLTLAASIGNVLTTLGQFVAGLRLLYKHSSETFGGIGGIFKNFGSVLEGLKILFQQTIGRLIPGFAQLGDGAKNSASAVASAFTSVGGIFHGIYITIRNAVQAIWNFIKIITEPFVNAVKKVSEGVTGTLGDMVDRMTDVFSHGDKAAENTVMFKVLTAIATAIKFVIAVLAKLGEMLRSVFVVMAKEIGTAGLGNVIEKLLNISILLTVKKFITRLQALVDNLQSIAGTFDGLLTETKRSLIAFQRNLQTKRILEIAVAVGLLAGALLLLSTINPKGMATGLAALAGTMFILVAGVTALQKSIGDKKSLGTTSLQIIALAAAIDIMASAVKKLSTLNLAEIGKGLLALAGTMAIMVAAVKILGVGGKTMMKGALQLILMAQAVKMLTNVAKDLSGMSWQEIGKGLSGLGGIMAEILIFAKIMNKTKIKMTTATAMVIMAQAIKQLIAPIKELGGMDLRSLGVGLGALGAVLLEIAGFSTLMSKFGKKMGMFKATGILILVQAIKQLIDPIKQLASMKLKDLGTGLGAIGTILLELAAFSAIMSKIKGGIFIDSVSIVILVKALQSLVPVIQSFGGMDILSLGKGLGTIAIALIAICSALKIVGKGGLVAGLAFVAVANGISIMAASVKMLGLMDLKGLAAGVGALVVTVGALTAAVKLMKGAVDGAAAFLIVANALFVLAPAIAVLGNMPIDSMITAIIGLAGALGSIVLFGKLAQGCVAGIIALAGALAIIGVAFVAFGGGVMLFGIGINTIIDAAVKVKDAAKDIVTTFVTFGKGIALGIIEIVKGLGKGAGAIAKAAVNIVIRIVAAIAKNMPKIVDSAYKLILGFINGLAEGAEKYLPEIMNAIGRLMGGIVKGLRAWFEQFTQLGIEGMAKIIGAVLLVLGLFKLLSKAVSGFKASNIAGAVVMVAGIISIVAGLTILSEVPWQNLIAAATALSLTLVAFAGAMEFISKVKLNIAQVGLFLLGALSLVEVAGAISLLAIQPWQSFIPAAISILAVLAGYAAIYAFIIKMPIDPTALAKIALFLAGTLALIPVVLALKTLASEDYKSLIAAAASIVGTMTGFAAVFAVMSMIPIPAALQAIANMGIAVLGVTALLAIMGTIRQIPGFDWIINEGGQVLMKLGEIMGGFVGSIIAGFGKAVSSMLPQLGSDLGGFMINASPFFMGMKLIDAGTVSAVESLASAILTLSGAALLDGIARLFGSDFSELGTQLSSFADGVVAFANKTDGLDGDKVSSAANAAAVLAQLAGDVPLEGGLLGAIIGDRMPLDKLGEQLPKLGEGVKNFAASVAGIDESSIQAGLNAAKLLVSLTSETPLEGGLLGLLGGDRLSLDKIGEQLPKLGDGVKKFATSVAGIDEASIQAGLNAAKLLVSLSGETPLEGGLLGLLAGDRLSLDTLGKQLPALGTGLASFAANVKSLDQTSVAKGYMASQLMIKLAADMPSSGGVWGFLAGNSDSLDEFGRQLPVLGSGLSAFAANVKGLDADAAKNAMTIANMISALANGLPNEGGIGSWFTGDNTIEDFSEEIPKLGEGLREFSNNVAGINAEAVNTVSGTMRAVVALMDAFNRNKTDIGAMGEKFKTLGADYKVMANDMASASILGPEYFKKGVDTVISAVKKINKVDTSKVQSFFKNVSGMSDVGIKDISTAAKDSVDGALKTLKSKSSEFKKLGKTLMNKMKEGIASKSKTISSAVKNLASEASKAASKKEKSFIKAGKQLSSGFSKGIKNRSSKTAVTKAGAELAKAAIEGFNKEAEIHSPSKKGERSGNQIGEGAAKGIKDKKAKVQNAGSQLSGAALNGLTDYNKMQGFSNAGTNSANNYINGFRTAMNNSGIGNVLSGKFSFTNLSKQILGKDVTNKKKTKKDKDKNKNNKQPVVTTTPTTTGSSGGGGGGGGSTAKKEKWTKKDMQKVNKDYKEIVGTFAKNTKNFSKKFLKAGTSKKSGVAFIKITSDYIRSAIKNKSLRTAVSVFGNGLASSINKQLKVALKKNKAAKNLEKKMTKAGKKLNSAKDAKKEAEAIIKNSKSSAKEVAAAKKKLAKANKDVKKYQKEIDKYSKKLKKVANATAKSITTEELKKVTKKFSQFKSQFNSMEKGLGKSLAKIPKVVGSYIKNSKSATEYMNGAVKSFNKIYGKGGEKAINSYAQRMYEATDEYKQDVKTVEKLNKKHNDNVKKAEELKKKIKSTSNVKLKKKYAEELKQLKKDDKALIKELNTTVTRIAKGPAKALKEYKKKLVESYKSFVSISNWDISPKINLQGFEAMGNAAAKFSIFGDVMSNATKSFDMFSVTVSDSVDNITEAFDLFNNSMDTGMNLLERFTKTGTVEKEALIENADSQLEAYEEFYNGIEELRKKGIDDSLVDELEAQGPQALNYIRGFMNMNDDEVKAYNERLNKKQQWEAKVLEKNMQKQLSQYEKFNQQLEELAARGLSEGIINKLKQSGVSQASYVKAMLNMDDALLSNVEEIYAKSITYGDAEARKAAEIAGEDYGLSYREALHKAVEKDAEWDKKLEELADKKVHPEIIKKFREMGADSAGAMVDSILKEGSEGIDDINAMYNDYVKINTRSFLEVAKENQKNAEEYNNTMNRLKKEAVGLDPAIIKYIEEVGGEEALAYANSILSHIEDIPDINKLYWESGQSDVDTIIRNVNSQADFVDAYQANMEKLEKRFEGMGEEEKKKYLDYIREMGLEGNDLVLALANASDEKLAEYRKAIDRQEDVNNKERAKATMDAFLSRKKMIEDYAKSYEKLRKAGASQAMLDDIAAMAETDPQAAAEKVDELLNLYTVSPEQFKELSKGYAKYMDTGAKSVVNTLIAEYSKGEEVLKEKINKTFKSEGTTAVVTFSESLSDSVEMEGVSEKLISSGKLVGKKVGKAASKEIAKQSGSLPVKTITDSLGTAMGSSEVKQKLTKTGKNIVKSVGTGIEQNAKNATDSAKNVANKVHSKFSKKLSTANGKDISDKFMTAINSTMNSYYLPIVTTASTISGGIYDEFINRLNYNNGVQFSWNLVQGIIDGLNDEAHLQEVRNAAARVAKAAEKAAKKSAEVKSPSRVWEQIGAYMGAGMIIGLKGSEDEIGKTASDLASNATESLQNTISMLYDGLNNEINLNPVITPTLNLTKATLQARQLNSLINNQQLELANARFGKQVDEQNQNASVTQNFVQNNYSPKALSRDEIYRQTKNQFALAREVVKV